MSSERISNILSSPQWRQTSGNLQQQGISLDLNKIRPIMEGLVTELDQLEAQVLLPPKNEDLQSLGALWVLSGPGLMNEPSKNDPYANRKWSEYMSRCRFMYAANLQMRAATLHDGIFTPEIIFNGTTQENDDVKAYLDSTESLVSPEGVSLFGGDIRDTVSQVIHMSDPVIQQRLQYLLEQDRSLGIVTHAAHAMRLVHMIDQFKPFPKDLKTNLFLLPSRIREYQDQEIRGVIYYMSTGKAAPAIT